MRKHFYDKESRQLRLPRRKRLRYALAREITRTYTKIEIEHRGGIIKFDDAEFASEYFAVNEDAGLSLRYKKFVPWVCLEFASVEDAQSVAAILAAAAGHGDIIVETFTGFATLHRVEADFKADSTKRLARLFSARFPSAVVGPVECGQFLYVYEVVALPLVFDASFQTRISVGEVAKILGERR